VLIAHTLTLPLPRTLPRGGLPEDALGNTGGRGVERTSRHPVTTSRGQLSTIREAGLIGPGLSSTAVNTIRQLFRPAPLLVPEDVAVAVEANGLSVDRVRVELHHELRLRHRLFAAFALLPVARASECSRSVATRQTAVLELLPDEETDVVWIYRRLALAAAETAATSRADSIRKNRNSEN
jgi:hypothetical protein